MIFYFANNSCSLGVRIVLEELGLEYEARAIDLKSRAQFDAAFTAVNPKRKVPALLREDGTLLTEFQAITHWLARSHPHSGLLAGDLEGQIRTMEVMDFIVGSVHMRGYTFVAVPGKFTANADLQGDLVAHGRAQMALGLERLCDILGSQDWLIGAYSIADAALFYLVNWAVQRQVPLPANIAAHHARMRTRPAVQRALAGEGVA